MINENVQNRLNSCFKWACLFLLMLVLQYAKVGDGIYPFGFVMLFVLVWCNQNIYIASIGYFACAIIFSASSQSIACAVCTIFVFLLFYWLHKKYKKPLSPLLICVYAFLSQAMFLYYNVASLENLAAAFFSLVLSIIFLMASLNFFQAILVKKFKYRFSIDQIVCGAVFLIGLSMALSNFAIFGIELVEIFAVFALFFSAFVLGGLSPLFFGVIIGVGSALTLHNPSFVMLFACFAFCILVFREQNKFVSLVAIALTDVFLGLYVGVYANYSFVSLIAIGLGALAFFIIPAKSVVGFRKMLEQTKDKQSLRNIANRSREGMERKLLEISMVFGDMEKVFKTMVRGSLPTSEIKQMLTQELSQAVCKDCKERNVCLRLMSTETLNVFNDLDRKSTRLNSSH